MTELLTTTPALAATRAGRPLVPPQRDIAAGVPLPEVAPPLLDGEAPISETFSDAPRPNLLRGYARQLNPFAYAHGRPGVSLLILGVVGLMTGADQNVLFILLPRMRAAFGANLELALVVNTSVNYLTMLVLPLMGFVADRVRRVWMLRIGGMIQALASMLMGLAGSPGQVLGLLQASRVGVTIAQPAVSPLIADYVAPTVRGRAYAFVLQVGTIGGLAIPILIGLLGDVFGWQGAYIAVGGVSVLGVLLYLLLREPTRGGTDRAAAATDAAITVQKPVSLSESFRRARASTTLRRLWYAQIFMGAAAFANLIIPVFLTDVFHLSSLQYGAIVSAEAGTVFVAQLVSGPLVDRWLSTTPSSIMYALCVMPLVLIGELVALWLAPSVWVAIAALLVGAPASYLITPLFSPPLNAVISLVVPARIRGFAFQSIQPWGLFGTILLLVVFGALRAGGVGEREQLLSFIPFLLVASAILAFAGAGVAGDMRSALAAATAEEDIERSRRDGGVPLLVCRDVQVHYEGAQVLFGVDLDLRPGEIVALLGTNGAGKSTLLNAITGLHPASSGAIYLDGEDVTYVPPDEIARRGVMLMPGGRALFASLTVRENLAAVRWAEPGGDGIDEALQRFPQLRALLGTVAGELSGGEQQMVALAQAFLRRPRLLLVDELSLGLAPSVVTGLLEGLRELARGGMTIVVVEQSVNVALQVAEHAVFMEKGRVVYQGRVADLVSRPDIVRSVFLSHAAGASTLTRRAQEAPSDDDGPAVVVRDVAVRYGSTSVLDGVSLSVDRAEVVGVVGPNGAGKTTLFDVIAGSVAPAHGDVWLAGRKVTDLPVDARARLGLVRSYQNVRLFPALTVRENIAVALERHLHPPTVLQAAVRSPATRRTERRVARRVDNLVETLGLESAANKFLAELSTGMRRIVDLGCLLAAQPEVLLLDEPSSGLAQAEVEQLGPLVRRIVAETRCALLVIEHDLGLVASLSTRLVALDLGHVTAEGPPGEVLARADVVATLLGGASAAALERSNPSAPPASANGGRLHGR